MHFKLLVVFLNDAKIEAVVQAARDAGATGITMINSARGEGIEPAKTFFGLSLTTQRDVLLLVVEEHLSRQILECICEAGGFETEPGNGMALQLDVEDVVGVAHQASALASRVEEEL